MILPVPCRSEPRNAAPPAPRSAGDFDVLICGASFAGLAIARELRSTGARVLVLDRYEIGERQTSACAAPTEWLRNLGLDGAIRQTFGDLVCHTPAATRPLGAPVHVVGVRLPRAVRAAVGAARRGDGVRDRQGPRPRGRRRCGPTAATVRAPLIVDALGWKRMLARRGRAAAGRLVLARAGGAPGRHGRATSSCGSTSAWSQTGYGWAFPAGDEVRIGIGSFDPHDHVKEPTIRLAEHAGFPPDGYQGNWIPHRIRDGDRGRRVLRRRLGGALHPAHRRGDPHRVVLRHRLRARAARGARGALDARARRWSATAPSRARTRGSSSACSACRRAIPRLRPRPLGAARARVPLPGAPRTGRSSTT